MTRASTAKVGDILLFSIRDSDALGIPLRVLNCARDNPLLSRAVRTFSPSAWVID
jgi:hypothetical protein